MILLIKFEFIYIPYLLFQNSAGERLAHISYMPLEVVDYNKKLIKDSKSRSKEDYWETLIRRLKLRHSELPTRFDHVTVMRTYRQAEMEEAGGKVCIILLTLLIAFNQV